MAPGDKQRCPFCGTAFVGIAPDGQTFYSKHEQICDRRTPPNAMSLPIQERITECLKCGGKEFKLVAHIDEWHPRRALWEYSCKACGQHHTSLGSLNAIAAVVPYDIKGPDPKPPRWDR